MTHIIDRRQALTAVAAVPAAAMLPAAGLCMAAEGPSELAVLAQRYFAEVETFNTSPDLGDDNFFHADQPFDVTLQRMVGVPVRSIEDALAAVEVVLHEGEGCMIDLSSESAADKAAASCLHALRDYLAGRVA